MDDFMRLFERIQIQQLRTFLLCGVDDSETDSRSYELLLREECKPLYNRLESLYPDGKERDDFFSDVSKALVAYEQVYLEIGIKAGARLIYQLLLKEDEV